MVQEGYHRQQDSSEWQNVSFHLSNSSRPLLWTLLRNELTSIARADISPSHSYGPRTPLYDKTGTVILPLEKVSLLERHRLARAPFTA